MPCWRLPPTASAASNVRVSMEPYQGTGISVRAPGVRNSITSARITLSTHTP